jgi:hypothetical protein
MNARSTQHVTTFAPADKMKRSDKPMTDAITLVVLDKHADAPALRELVTIRCSMGASQQASRVYADVWIHTPSHYGQWGYGSGWAGGGGYCKRSAAIGEALANAGVKLSDSIHGRGMSAVREALEAIARHFGYEVWTIVEH